MLAAGLAQITHRLGRGLGDLHVDLAVQKPQRIPLQTGVAILAQLREMGAAVIEHRLAKRRAALGASERVEFHLELEPKLAPQLVDHYQQLGVARRVGAPEHLDPELVELAIAPLLRTLVAQHRPAVEEALLRVAAIEPRLDIGAHHARRSLRAQHDPALVLALAALLDEVHLLLDDIRGRAGRAHVEFDSLQRRNPNLLDRVTLHQRPRALLDEAYRPHLRTHQVLKSSKSGQFHGIPKLTSFYALPHRVVCTNSHV